MVMSDQSFTPILPAEGDKRCLKIARLENSSLDELAKEWIDMSRHREISRGTVLLLGSLSHMRRAGVSGYCEDFVEASKQITAANSGKVWVAPLPIIFTAGTSSLLAIRTAAEVNKEFEGVDWFMADSYRLAMSIYSTPLLTRTSARLTTVTTSHCQTSLLTLGCQRARSRSA
jgi:hypothetical protein